jgi:hypothetical protein
MTDYTWPSVYFAYLFFAISLGVGVYFFLRSWKDGYWGKDGEDIKYTVFDDAGTSPDGGADAFVCQPQSQPRRPEGRRQAGRPAPHKD